LFRPKQKEKIYVKKIGSSFEKDGYVLQPFKICFLKGKWFEPQHYHACCLGCGNYFRVPLKNLKTFKYAGHVHEPLSGVVDNGVAVDIDNLNEAEASPVLLFDLMKVICHSNLPFDQASSKFLTSLVREAIAIGRAFPNVPPELLIPEVSAAKLSDYANFMGFSKQDVLLTDLHGEKVSILLDTGKGSIFIYSHLTLFSQFLPEDI
jgi:hypothetical protein